MISVTELSQLREAVIQTFLPNEQRCVTRVVQPAEGGLWAVICGQQAYMGDTPEAVLNTARYGDWFIANRDGPLTEELRKHFNQRDRTPPEVEPVRCGHEKIRYQANRVILESYLADNRNLEMDLGEPVFEKDLEGPTHTVKSIVYLLFEVKAGKHTPPPGFYLRTENQVERVTLKVTLTGWVLRRTGETHPIPRRATLTQRAMVVLDEHNNLLNLRLFDKDGKQLLRLMGDSRGNICLGDLTLT